MKYKGKHVDARCVETLILPREGGDPFIFTAQSILDYKPFEDLCPEPQAPAVIKPGGIREENRDDPSYTLQVENRERNRVHWLVIESLKVTEDLEWEKVKDDDPNTWKLWETELREAGFSQMEINRVHMLCLNVNSLNESKLEKARKDFLAGQAQESGK